MRDANALRHAGQPVLLFLDLFPPYLLVSDKDPFALCEKEETRVSRRPSKLREGGTATCIVRFRYAPRSDLRGNLTETLLVDSGEGDGVRGRGGGCDVGREVDEDGVREAEFEVESLRRLRTGGVGSERRWDVFDGCAVADADEPDGEGVALGDADDGVGEEGAGETPHGALVLYGWVLDVDDKVIETRCLSLCALLLLLSRETDEGSQLDGELPLRTLDDCLSRRRSGCACGQTRELDCDGARYGNGG